MILRGFLSNFSFWIVSWAVELFQENEKSNEELTFQLDRIFSREANLLSEQVSLLTYNKHLRLIASRSVLGTTRSMGMQKSLLDLNLKVILLLTKSSAQRLHVNLTRSWKILG